MNGFIAIVVAHDSSCAKGEEWMFHGIVSDEAYGTQERVERHKGKGTLEQERSSTERPGALETALGCFCVTVGIIAIAAFVAMAILSSLNWTWR